MSEFEILGAIRIIHNGYECTPTPPKVLRVLAVLLLHANQLVSIDSLIEELWGDVAPRSAVATTHTYIHQIRRFIFNSGIANEDELLLTRRPGYILRISDGELDLDRFERLLIQGQRLFEAKHLAEAGRTLRQALGLWRGVPLANVSHGSILESHAVRLGEQKLRAIELRIQVDVQLGRHFQLVGDLRKLVNENPFNEWLHGQLIAALSNVGRRNDALLAYHHLRALLNEELGLEPSPEIRRLQQNVLGDGMAYMEGGPDTFDKI